MGYIEREKIGLTDFEIVMCNGDYKEAFKMLLEKIESIPAADVRPVVRGKWRGIGKTSRIFVCSVCDKTFPYKTSYCPNCGADMMEADNEKA